MTDEELAAIKARAEAATPGPWLLPATDEEFDTEAILDGQGSVIASFIRYTPDAAFIAHARADIPSLVAAYEAALEIVRAVAEAHSVAVGPYASLVSQKHNLERLRLQARALLGTGEGEARS